MLQSGSFVYNVLVKKRYFSNPILPSEIPGLLPENYRLKNHVDLNGKRPALLVLDMQEYFLNDDSHAFVPSAPAILPGMVDLSLRFVEYGYPVIFTQHLNDPLTAGMMAVWWRDMIRHDHPHASLHPDLPTDLGRVIPKGQYDAFFDTGLENYLHDEQVTDVIITGVMTHLCCETTARSAFMRGFETWFPVDGTATYNEEYHRASLLNLSHGFAHLVTMESIQKGLE